MKVERSHITPDWVYEIPEYKGADVRVTPRHVPFRDADWVEPDTDWLGKGVVRTRSVSARGGIVCPNSTPFSHFENPRHYVKWVRNPRRRTLWHVLLRMFGIKSYARWIPFEPEAPKTFPGFHCGCCGAWVARPFQGKEEDTIGLCDECVRPSKHQIKNCRE